MYLREHISVKRLTGKKLSPSKSMGLSAEGNETMTLMEAAELVERMQSRAAHIREYEALRIARDALLTIVSEGFLTLPDRLNAVPLGFRTDQAEKQPKKRTP
jgi:hypothetical protein